MKKTQKHTHTHTLTVGPTFTAGSSHQQFLGLQRAPDDPHHLHALLLRQVRILAVGALNHQTCNTERLTFWATSGWKPCAFNTFFFSKYQNSRQHWCHLRHCSYEGRTLFTPPGVSFGKITSCSLWNLMVNGTLISTLRGTTSQTKYLTKLEGLTFRLKKRKLVSVTLSKNINSYLTRCIMCFSCLNSSSNV